MLFQVLSIDRLEALSCELSLVKRRGDALSKLI